jgi:hypothetical protein
MVESSGSYDMYSSFSDEQFLKKNWSVSISSFFSIPFITERQEANVNSSDTFTVDSQQCLSLLIEAQSLLSEMKDAEMDWLQNNLVHQILVLHFLV